MTFKNEREFERYLLKKCRLALLKAQDEVYVIIKKFLYQYYTEYSPEMYDRTLQLLESLVQSRIVSDGKGYKAEIYFNISELNYTSGGQPTGEQVMAAATRGLHGAIGKIPNSDKYFRYVDIGDGTKVWDDPKKVLDAKAINILKQMLISEGIPIK